MAEKFIDPRCAACPFKPSERFCMNPKGKHPEDCPTVHHPEIIEEARQAYQTPELAVFAKEASLTERGSYFRLPSGILKPFRSRLEEIVAFSKKMGYKKLGLVFCFGLRKEAAIIAKVLETNGFDVASAACKVGGLPKESLGLTREDQLEPKFPESMCNPVMQAKLMNAAKTDFNILVGLCVGHDTMAIKYLEAPVTVLVAKDRLLGHNPLAAVYQCESYYRYVTMPQD
ncbi:MAG: DUF1847 domain-containing protein [Desulfovibrionaceae bacterium]|nr:DUF1847 domain-containing protein [Desulfovibrionaceae bacterium]